MHENLHKNVNENPFSFTFLCKFLRVFFEGQLKQQMILNPFKMAVQFF